MLPTASTARVALVISSAAFVACAPAAPTGSGDKTEPTEVGMLESMVVGHFDTFMAVEDLAMSNGIDLETERTADWPQSGEATVNFGQSAIRTVFTVDREDYTRISRTWSVNLDLAPMEAAGVDTTGELTGTWDYWEEGEEDDLMGWVILDLAGTVLSPDHPTGAATTVYAIVNEEGAIYQAAVDHGGDTWSVSP